VDDSDAPLTAAELGQYSTLYQLSVYGDGLSIQEQELFQSFKDRYVRSARSLQRKREEQENADKALLMSLLAPEQRLLYTRENKILVEGSDGFTYEIHCNDYQGNITRKSNRGNRQLCAHISFRPVPGEGQGWGDPSVYGDHITLAQHHLAQYMRIKTDAEGFVDVAF
jgi:hypothetical protein